MKLNTVFILASQSPRRRHLLRQLGISFNVIPSNANETVSSGMPPESRVRELAMRKAHAVSCRRRDALVLGADTVVVHRGLLIGKPSSPQEATAILRRLSGSTHTVFTGMALMHDASGRSVTATESTEVTFGRLSDGEIARYVATGAPMDKAGAYGIQDDMGALFVQHIKGDYYTVVGLPLRRLYLLIKKYFADFLAC